MVSSPGLPRAPTWASPEPAHKAGQETLQTVCNADIGEVSFSLLRGADFAAIFRPQNLDHFRGSFVIVIEAADEYDPKTVLFLGSVCLRIGARLNDEVFSAGSTSNPKSIGS